MAPHKLISTALVGLLAAAPLGSARCEGGTEVVPAQPAPKPAPQPADVPKAAPEPSAPAPAAAPPPVAEPAAGGLTEAAPGEGRIPAFAPWAAAGVAGTLAVVSGIFALRARSLGADAK